MFNKKLKKFLNEYYFLIVPVLITILLYFISLTYGFRNFDENILIQNNYLNKTFDEFLDKFFLLYTNPITKAEGLAFSSIENVHFSPLGTPLHYLICYIFKANPFLFHTWGLVLHLFAILSLAQLFFKFTNNKNISLTTSLIWAIHPTNVESVVWATNWTAPLGAILYFYTLNQVISLIKSKNDTKKHVAIISLITMFQILFAEYNITIPLAIIFTIFYFQKYSATVNTISNIFKYSFIPTIITLFYLVIRFVFVHSETSTHTQNGIIGIIERLVYLTPQTFLHNLWLIIFPHHLSIDQLDLLTLDNSFLGIHHIASIIILIVLLLTILLSINWLPLLSYGLALYLIAISPFCQIIPLYSLVAERYNYFGAAFLIFGIVASLFKLFENKKRILLIALTITSLVFGIRSYFRITDWKNSKTLFLSTANTSKSLLKKGIWTYNLALSEDNEHKKDSLLRVSANLLNLFIENTDAFTVPSVLEKYELDYYSLIAKAHLRLAKIYEILGDSNLEYKHLNNVLKLARPDSLIIAKAYQNLATLYFQQNSYKKAIEYYEKSYSISPNSTINFAIAVCHLKLDNIDNYGKYLKLTTENPSNSDPRAYLPYGQFLELQKGDYKEAIKHYKIASLLENKVESYILLATLYFKLNEMDKALKTVKNGLYGFPEDPMLNYLFEALKNNQTLMIR